MYPFAGVGVAGEGNDTPEATATAFLHAYGGGARRARGLPGPRVLRGTFQVHPTDSNGTARTDIVRSTLAMQKIGEAWTVVDVYTDPVDIRDAKMIDDHTLQLFGWGKGFEQVLHIQVIGQGSADFRRNTTTVANGQAAASDPELPRQFTANVDVSGSSGQVATIVISNEDKDGAPADLVAVTFKLR